MNVAAEYLLVITILVVPIVLEKDTLINEFYHSIMIY